MSKLELEKSRAYLRDQLAGLDPGDQKEVLRSIRAAVTDTSDRKLGAPFFNYDCRHPGLRTLSPRKEF